MDRAAIGRWAVGAALLLAAPLSFAQAWKGPGASFQTVVTGGVTVEVPRSVWPAVPDGLGGASLGGNQLVKVPGGQSANLVLSRAVSKSGLVVGARIAARLAGPIGLAMTALDALRWSEAVGWEKMETQYEQDTFDTSACFTNWPSLTTWLTYTPVAGQPGRYRVRCVYDGGTLIDYGITEVIEHTMWVPAEDADIEAAVSSKLSADPSLAATLLRSALQHGATLEDLGAGPLVVTGPSSLAGPTQTSTLVGPEGTTTRTTTTIYNFNYAGNTVRITEAVTTTTTLPDTTVITETTETEAPGGDGSEPPAPQDPLCELYPEASGCAPLGTPLPAEALPEEERPLSFEPETIGAAGVCPEPLTTTVLGKEVKIDWSWTCDALTMLRPLVLALSWLGAIFWVFGIGRATT